ncbi:type II secretion system F family protein [Advenella sp. S44]|uniref:type II secretion system F family protein n=1 Tax=Advenella sp. S44 TaxID=1982755 RepID=UPI001374733D|nr:type II secretion system F family protein [Advenella sp. S44]
MSFWISCVLTGISICLCLYLFLSPASNRTIVPQAYRKNRVLVLLWPWIYALGHAVLPFMSWKYRARLWSLLRSAGFDRMAQIDHVAGIQSLAACALGASGVILQMPQLIANPFTVMATALFMTLVGFFLPLLWLRDRAARRKHKILRELPFLLDMTTLCVEAGQNLQGALYCTANLCSPGILRDELSYCLGEIRTGKPRIEALRAMAERTGIEEVMLWVASIAQAESMGMALGPLLRSQSDQRRQERFNRAEKLALEAPVKMLMPLVFCIFPCTFIVLAFPIAMKILQSGV